MFSWPKNHDGLIEFKVLTFSNPFEEPVTCLLVFGSQLLALSEDGGRLLVWDIRSGGERGFPSASRSLMSTRSEF